MGWPANCLNNLRAEAGNHYPRISIAAALNGELIMDADQACTPKLTRLAANLANLSALYREVLSLRGRLAEVAGIDFGSDDHAAVTTENYQATVGTTVAA
jgi:hypothetical protein